MLRLGLFLVLISKLAACDTILTIKKQAVVQEVVDQKCVERATKDIPNLKYEGHKNFTKKENSQLIAADVHNLYWDLDGYEVDMKVVFEKCKDQGQNYILYLTDVVPTGSADDIKADFELLAQTLTKGIEDRCNIPGLSKNAQNSNDFKECSPPR